MELIASGSLGPMASVGATWRHAQPPTRIFWLGRQAQADELGGPGRRSVTMSFVLLGALALAPAPKIPILYLTEAG